VEIPPAVDLPADLAQPRLGSVEEPLLDVQALAQGRERPALVAQRDVVGIDEREPEDGDDQPPDRDAHRPAGHRESQDATAVVPDHQQVELFGLGHFFKRVSA